MRRLFRQLLVTALGLGLVTGMQSVASAVSIELIVNGIPVTDYEISQRVALARISGGTPTTAAATQQLIDEILQLEEGLRRGISPSGAQIETAFASIASSVGLGPTQFEGALREAGVDPDTLRANLRAQIAWAGVMQSLSEGAAPIRQSDVTAALLAQGGGVTTVREYLLQPIVFVIPQGSSNSVVSQRRSEAEAFRQRFAGCDGALAQAQALRNVVVLDIVRRDSTQLAGDQGAEIQRLSVGRTTSPTRTDSGYEIVAVCSITEVQSNEAARAEVANQLIQDLGVEVGQDFLAELRADAIIQRL